MNFFQHECYLHARVPRIKRDDKKIRLIPPSWSGKLNGFTLLFEAFFDSDVPLNARTSRQQVDQRF